MSALIATMTFGALLAACAPRIGAVTMRSIVTYESGGRPYAIGDNSARRS